ncbi:hypothetical protein CIPAW_09G026300 [Carya illinoinensis]|nr:hypothetical protein CIPAW_09G026300 [Carya illinoinensis]KAG6640765.1 hypothetical protein CIPAW_09G026300 [Carya illinoinensis]
MNSRAQAHVQKVHCRRESPSSLPLIFLCLLHTAALLLPPSVQAPQVPQSLSPLLYFFFPSRKQKPRSMGRLAPLSEVPINGEEDSTNSSKKGRGLTWRNWIKTHLSLVFNKKSDLRILLSVLGCPLFPIPLHPKQSIINEVSSSAQYIIQHFTAATGCRKLEGMVKSIFATGKVTMAMLDELGSGGSAAGANGVSQKGCFVMWQMVPDKWLIELVVGGHKVVAGSDGSVAWRHTPWLGAHTARGGVRPLRRALQGLDPLAIAAVFSSAQHLGEKRISGVDCFALQLSADQADLAERGDKTAEMIKHVIYGYFSQRSGLLVYLEDSYLTRIQSPGAQPMYWETTMSTRIEDYRTVEGVMIAHAGHSSVIITRFGDNLKSGPTVTRMEETWAIDDVAFNVPGLSIDCFIPPTEVKRDYPEDDLATLFRTSSSTYFFTSSTANKSEDPVRPEPPPIRVSLTESAGRGVFATRRIGAGDLIHTARPLVAHPLLSTTHSVCYFCLRKLKATSQTQAIQFCSNECEEQSMGFYNVERRANWSDYDNYCRMHGLKYPLLVKRLACMVISGVAAADSFDILQPESLSPVMVSEMEEGFNLLRGAFTKANICDEQVA